MRPNDREFKQSAARIAVNYIQSNMIVGLGSGSTAEVAVTLLAEKIQTGQLENVLGVPSSLQIKALANKLAIPLTTLEQHPSVDITIDGADEINPKFQMIKGGGGALLREKILAQASKQLINMVDDSKLSPHLGTNWAVPVEVLPFGWRSQASFIESLGAKWTTRTLKDGSVYTTDQGNLILDCAFGPIHNPESLSAELGHRAGIIEHGLFIGFSPRVIICGEQGCKQIKPD